MTTTNWKAVIGLVFCLITFTANAQECFWAAQAGGSGQDGSGPIATDNNGNIYVAGDFTSSTCNFQTVTLLCHGYNDVFIARYDPSGSEVWVKQFYAGWSNETDFSGSSLDNDLIITGMVFDSLDHTLLATGTFFQHMMLPNSTIVYGRHFDVFVMKMDLEGNILWIKTGGSEFEDLSMGIAYDEQENVYVTGVNRYPATFGDTTISAGGFIAKYDLLGNLIWVKNKFRYSTDNLYYTEAPPQYAICSDHRLIIFGMVTASSILIDTIAINGLDPGNSSFLASFSEAGDIQWLQSLGGSTNYGIGQISTDTSNNILLTGLFDHMGIYGEDTLYTNDECYDYFLTKVTKEGEFLWVIQGNSTETAWGTTTFCDISGNVYSCGSFHDTIFFGNEILVSNSYYDMFLVSYTSNGLFRGVVKYDQGEISGMVVDKDGNLIFAGYFLGSLDIGQTTITSYGSSDFFAAKCSPITSTKESPPAPSNQLAIYANPNTGKCNITIPEEFRHEEELTLYIYDSQGRLVQKAALEHNEETYRLDIRAQAVGIYQAILTNGTKQYTGKIVFEKN